MFSGKRTLGVLLFAVLALSACSGSASFSIGGKSVEEAGEELIAGELADQLGLGPLTPACPEVQDAEIGTTFSCSATTEDGRTILFDGVVDTEDHINLETSNVAIPDKLEQQLFQTLSDQNPDVGLTRDGVDCGDQTVVVDASSGGDNRVDCTVQPTDGPSQTATLTINDLETGDIDFAFAPLDGASDDPASDAAAADDTDGSDEAAGSMTPDEVAQLALITLDDLGPDWVAEPRSEDTTDYNTIDGCGSIADLVDNDGHVAEAKSAEFTSGNTSVIHDVRVYADDATALEVVVAWSEQLAIDCAVAGAEQSANEAFATGELDPYEEVQFNLQAFQDLDGEPRYTNLELSNTLLGPDLEFVVINDAYFVQVGRMVSQVIVTTPTETWADTPTVLDIVASYMDGSKAALQGS